MNRPRLVSTFTGLLLAFSIAASGLAQEREKGEGRRRGGQGGFGGMGLMGGFTIDKPTLLGSPQVRSELKIGEDQGKKVDEVLASHREASRDLFPRQRGEGSDEDRAKAREEMATKRAELVKKTDAKLAEVLEKAQMQRLEEILLQQRGADALVSEQVIASLKLSNDQVEKIKTALAARDRELTGLRPRRGEGGGGGGGGGEEAREKVEKARKEGETAALAVLSKEQTETYTKMKGASFELDRRSLFQGRGGPGGGGGRQGGGSKDRKRPQADDEKSI